MAAHSIPIPEFILGSVQETRFRELLKQRENLVPFIGAGLSVPLCPSWGGFIEQYYGQVKGEYLDEDQCLAFEGLKKLANYEAMLDLLFSATSGLVREKLLNAAFKLEPDAAMHRKLALLHKAFPNLMITTNIDNLVFQTAPGGIHIYHGKQSQDLKRALIGGQRALLAIHGDLANLDSLVFSKKEYDQIYGAHNSFDPDAALPKFLAEVFDNHRLLFLGCSLDRDRVLEVLAARPVKRIHFALLHEKLKTREFLQRLSMLYIEPIWISDYGQVETILACLAGPVADRASIDAPPVFVGRNKELARLKQNLTQGGTNIITGRLFTLEGAGGIGKTTLAREAAAQLSESFPDGTLEFAIERFNPMTFAVELGKRLGFAVDEPATPELARSLISQLLKDRKILLLLDNLVKAADLPFMIPTDNQTALMVTTRDRDCFQYLSLHRWDLQDKLEQLKLERFTPKEAMELCKRTLGKSFLKAERVLYREIAERLGFLPVALRPAYHLMAFNPHYSATELLARLKGREILTVLAEARDRDLGLVKTVYALDSEWLEQEEHRVLLAHMAWCAPGPIPIDFLTRFYDKPNLRNTLEELQTRCWCTRQEGPEGPTCELHILVRETVKSQTSEDLDDKLITLIGKAYREEHFEIKDRWLAQFQETRAICRKNRDRRQVAWLNGWFFHYCEQRGHTSLFINLADQVMDLFPEDHLLAVGSAHKSAILQTWGRLQEACDLNQFAMEKFALLEHKEGLASVYGNQALILSRWGRLEEAMALHQKVQVLFEELGNRAGLARCYGNQALILTRWGRLEEAMALLQKEQVLKEELGNRAGLARCYGNQALILKNWGRLEEAMALHQKEQALKEELGNRAGLAGCYGNQALILSDWGRLEQAMALLQKEQVLEEELGNRAGLARCYGNQALILIRWGRLEQAMALLQKEQVLEEELGNRAGLAGCYGNQALILIRWGRLEQAMALFQKEQVLNEELGNRVGLAICLWNQGILLAEMGEPGKAAESSRRAIQIRREIGIPVEQWEKELAEWEASQPQTGNKNAT